MKLDNDRVAMSMNHQPKVDLMLFDVRRAKAVGVLHSDTTRKRLGMAKSLSSNEMLIVGSFGNE